MFGSKLAHKHILSLKSHWHGPGFGLHTFHVREILRWPRISTASASSGSWRSGAVVSSEREPMIRRRAFARTTSQKLETHLGGHRRHGSTSTACTRCFWRSVPARCSPGRSSRSPLWLLWRCQTAAAASGTETEMRESCCRTFLRQWLRVGITVKLLTVQEEQLKS